MLPATSSVPPEARIAAEDESRIVLSVIVIEDEVPCTPFVAYTISAHAIEPVAPDRSSRESQSPRAGVSPSDVRTTTDPEVPVIFRPPSMINPVFV